MFLPKRYQQLDVDLGRLALFARPDWKMEDVVWMDSRAKLKEIEPWIHEQAMEGLGNLSNVNVSVGPSLVEGAGDGVFCERGSPAGRLLCVHPGTIHQASTIRVASERGSGPLFERIFIRDLPHCVQLFDGTLIDAGVDSLREWTPHPFAVGHKCNHPPKGSLPNVIKCPFWWKPIPPVNVIFQGISEKNDKDDEDSEQSSSSFIDRSSLVERIREELGFSSTTDSNGMIRGLGFVSTREILSGEELFVNYRYNPKSTLPEWYHAVDSKEDEARWS